MTKQVAKQQLAIGIRNAVLCGKPEKIKLDKVIEIMNEKKINRNMLKATIRAGNASFLAKDDPDGSKTEAMKEQVCSWIEANISKNIGK